MTRAVRFVEDGEIVYVMPYSERGRRVVYRQNPDTFDTRRETVAAEKAARLAARGREVSLAETPAWCDPAAPAAAHATAQPPQNHSNASTPIQL